MTPPLVPPAILARPVRGADVPASQALAAAIGKVAWFQARDVARSRWLAAYAVFFGLVTEALLRFAGGDARSLLSLTSVVLLVVPLVTLVFGTIYLYNAREFIELLLVQPVRRGGLFLGLYVGLAAPLALAVALGAGAPFLLHGFSAPGQGASLGALLGMAVVLTGIFTAIAFLIALRVEERLKGLGGAIGAWLLAAVVYDGLVLAVVAGLADYPLERPMLALMLANPIDLARVMMILQLDVSALMGYTGAVFQRTLGSGTGTMIAAGALALWLVVPLALARRAFHRKDF